MFVIELDVHAIILSTVGGIVMPCCSHGKTFTLVNAEEVIQSIRNIHTIIEKI